MLFFLYLKEIRYRILYCFISLIYSWLICFIFVEELIYYLTKPLLFIDLGSKEIFNHFIFTNLGDAFFSFFNLSLSIGFCISLYFFIFQFFCYIISSLYLYEKNILRLVVSFSFISICISLLFWYFIFLPIIFHFFLGFELTNTNFSFEILFEGKIDEYFSFILTSLYSLIIVFQFPILLFFLVIFDQLKITLLIDYRKIVYFGFLLVSAFLTPPDVFSQFFFVLPLIIFYEVVIFFIFLFNEYK